MVKQNKEEEWVKAMWREAKYKGTIDSTDTRKVLHLTEKEASRCRFKIANMNLRMAECVVHIGEFSHGVRIHPIHLYKLSGDGSLYYRRSKSDAWTLWKLDIKANAKRLKDDT